MFLLAGLLISSTNLAQTLQAHPICCCAQENRKGSEIAVGKGETGASDKRLAETHRIERSDPHRTSCQIFEINRR